MKGTPTSWPQWSPSVTDGMTPRALAVAGHPRPAATEPVRHGRDDGSPKTSQLTCNDRDERERFPADHIFSFLCAVVKVRVRPLTWARALPGVRVTTEALAWSDDDGA